MRQLFKNAMESCICSWKRKPLPFWLTAMLILQGVVGNSFARNITPEKEFLRENDIKLDDQSLHAFFASMNPQGDIVAKTRKLIALLDHENFRTREEATTQLLRIPRLPLEIVQQSAKGGTPEVRWRCALVVQESGAKSQALLRAALRVIEHDSKAGFCQDIINCVHFYKGSSVMRRTARDAFLASVSKDEHELLKKIGKHENSELRVYAVRSLIQLYKKDAVNEVRSFLADEDDEVRMEAAAMLGNLGQRSAIMTLADLLESKELPIRSRAVQLLRSFTDQKFRFVAYGPDTERTKAVAKWQNWLATNLETAELNTGVALTKLRIGRILVCYYDKNRVVEYDEAHKVVWELTVDQPWGCQGLPNGHRLITCFNRNKVIEYDESGKEVWQVTVSGNPAMAYRLENGNTLVSLYSQNRVIEITPDNKTVNTIRTSAPASFAERNEDGSTLVALAGSSGVVEYDADGKQLRTYPMSRAFSARRLENGNILAADTSGTVKELGSSMDPGTKRPSKSARTKLPDKASSVWSHTIGTPYDAYRLDNGNTLIAHQGGITEVDREGKVIWSERGKGSGIRVCYY